jgi:TP901-1 family phage major tail protein
MAQTTGIINSSSIRVFLGTTDDSEVVVDHVTECSISMSTDMRDITTKTSGGWRELLPGLKSASLSLSGLFAEDAPNVGFNALVDHQIAGELLYVIFTNTGSTAAANAGDEQFDVAGYITSLEQTAGVEDNVGFSMTIEVTGTVVREVIT